MPKTKKSKKSKKSKKARRENTPEVTEDPDGQDEQGTIDEQLDEVFDQYWDEVDPRMFDDVPDGTYQTRILAAVLNNAQTSGRLQCSWEAIILGGEQKGRHVFKHDGLDTEDGLGFFQGNLARLGYEKPTSKKGLVTLLGEIVEAPTYVSIRLSTRKRKVEGEVTSIQNKRFVKALDSSDVDDEFGEDELVPTMGAALEGEASAETVEDTKSEYWASGDRIQTDIDGTTYKGKIKKMKGENEDTAVVLFDDGDTLDIKVDDLVEEEEKEEKEKGGKGETDEQTPPCELKTDKLSPADRRILKKLAKDDDFNSDDYDTKAQLLCEIGDYHGLSGKYKDTAALIKAIKKAINTGE